MYIEQDYKQKALDSEVKASIQVMCQCEQGILGDNGVCKKCDRWVPMIFPSPDGDVYGEEGGIYVRAIQNCVFNGEKIKKGGLLKIKTQ